MIQARSYELLVAAVLLATAPAGLAAAGSSHSAYTAAVATPAGSAANAPVADGPPATGDTPWT